MLQGKMKALVAVCWLLLFSAGARGSEGGEGGSEKSEETATSEQIPPPPPCAVPHGELFSIIDRLIDDELTQYNNCLSFDIHGSLVSGVISGVNETGGMGQRLELSCVESVIIVKESLMAPVAENMGSTACVSCNVEQTANICESPCAPRCERCFGVPDMCGRCAACLELEANRCFVAENSSQPINSNMCNTTCSSATELREDLFNFCECPDNHYKLLADYPEPEEIEEGTHDCDFFPVVTPYTCVVDCNEKMPGFDPSEESDNICFACGLPYCLECRRIADGPDECDHCMNATVLFEHECFACPKATVALVAEEQEVELEEEERDQYLRQIELAVSLPVLSVLVLLFFLGMSYFAHQRYPHINPKGHKRHRVMPDAFDDVPEASPIVSEGDFPTSPSDVWRARPTVRLR